MDDVVLNLADLSDELREFVAACEVSGQRTILTRNDQNVALLISWDEFMSLQETVSISADTQLLQTITAAEGEVERGEVVPMSDLDE
jgi:PHD/YefM family antitoxin component YafN of YafNO toxin-antitoxin module